MHISTPASWRGGEQQMAYLVGELKEAGITQWVACRSGSAVESFAREAEVPLLSRPVSSGIDPGFARMVAKFCKREQPDLIHAHDAGAHTFAVMAAAFWRNKTPIVVSRRVDFPVRNSWLSRYKYNHPLVKRILCVSNAIRAITSKGVQRPERCVTVYSGIDPKRFSPEIKQYKIHHEYGLKAETVLVGNVAALAPHKDYFTFLSTAKQLLGLGVDAQFIGIGSGSMQTELEDYAQKLGLGNRMIFTGFRTDVPDILPELDVFLITSETEGLGTSVLDAFAAKVPVVATAAGGIIELVEDGKTGLLGPIKDPKALAEAVKRVLMEPELAEQLVANATERLQHFTKTATAQKTLAVYRELVS